MASRSETLHPGDDPNLRRRVETAEMIKADACRGKNREGTTDLMVGTSLPSLERFHVQAPLL